MELKKRIVDVSTEAERLGFALVETVRDDETVWAWRRGTDTDWPEFATKGEAFAWMEDKIRTGMLFERDSSV